MSEQSISPPQYKALKNAIGRLLPQVRSSERAQAIARGLSYKTSAALVVALENGPCPCTFDALAFGNYLRDHGHPDVDQIAFTTAISEAHS